MVTRFRYLVCGFLAAAVMMTAIPGLAAGISKKIDVLVNSVIVKINGKTLPGDNLVYSGKVYIQADRISDMFGKTYTWDKSKNAVSINERTIPADKPDETLFKEYLKEFYLGRLEKGKKIEPPDSVPQKTGVFTSNDQFCTIITIIKTIPAGKIATAIYDVKSRKDFSPKNAFPNELKPGGMMGGEDMNFPVGKYEYRVYLFDRLAAVIPFEVK